MPQRIQYHRPHGAPTPHQNARAYDRHRQADKNFYSSTRWVKFRASFLAKNPLCVDCTAEGRVTLADHVHHIVPRKQRPDLAFDEGNCESCCQPHHNAKEIR